LGNIVGNAMRLYEKSAGFFKARRLVPNSRVREGQGEDNILVRK
jgi:hypothetical protein